MNEILGIILGFGVRMPVFGEQYAKLCLHLHDYLPRLGMICDAKWVVADPNISNTFRKMVILQCNDLFAKHQKYTLSENDRDSDDDEDVSKTDSNSDGDDDTLLNSKGANNQ
eukprot:122540_1